MRPLAASLAPIVYRVGVSERLAHLFDVQLTVVRPLAQQVVSLPVWIPGSYLIREFSRHLSRLQAHQGAQPVALTQLDKCSWRIDCAAGQPIVLTYQVYAFDASVRTAWLDAERGFFNGTSVCLRVHGQEDGPHALLIDSAGAPARWKVATALTAVRVTSRGFGSYLAANYDELLDSPVELGDFWSGSFVACGVTHRFVVAGAPASFDGGRLLADTKKICEAEIGFWHAESEKTPSRPGWQVTPHDRYVFMLSTTGSGYGGLEHSHSTALICKRADLPRVGQGSDLSALEGYTRLLGLISHEYFHTWNVKRLRPVEFARYDYTRENYTDLLWFFEGLTSYYDDLFLRRAGLIDDAHYLKLLTKTLNAVLQTPGRGVQSLAQASMDAWIKYYRQDENSVNVTISYYTKGALVGLCLDLSLRQNNGASLDIIMRALWQRCLGGPMSQDDLLAVLYELVGRDYGALLTQWVQGTDDLPVLDLLRAQGVDCATEPVGLAERIGVRVTEQGAILIKNVLRGGLAEQAGLAVGDEWLGIEVGQGQAMQAWRLIKLDDVELYAGPDAALTALVARDHRLLRLPLRLTDAGMQYKLGVKQADLVSQWLSRSEATAKTS